MASTYKGLSKRGRSLLERGEGLDVDYKERIKGLHAEDLVAFANSVSGGAILLGVREASGASGSQIGVAVGHPIDDDTRLQIMGKALSRNPPVQVELVVENVAAKPFYRIEIPSGPHKPYATNAGTYKIRENGRNAPILPEQLLRIFLERESQQFQGRFQQATETIANQLQRTLTGVEELESAITERIEEIGSSLGWAEYKAGDAADTISTVQAQVLLLLRSQARDARRLRAISRKVEADDPVTNETQAKVREAIRERLREDPSILEKLREGHAASVSLEGLPADELNEAELRALVHSVIDESKQ